MVRIKRLLLFTYWQNLLTAGPIPTVAFTSSAKNTSEDLGFERCCLVLNSDFPVLDTSAVIVTSTDITTNSSSSPSRDCQHYMQHHTKEHVFYFLQLEILTTLFWIAISLLPEEHQEERPTVSASSS